MASRPASSARRASSSASTTRASSCYNCNNLYNARLLAYLLALVALFWFTEIGSLIDGIDRTLGLRSSINEKYSTSDAYYDDNYDNYGDDSRSRSRSRMIASEMAILHPDECQGKERLLEILLNAGKEKVSVEDCSMLPTWKEVTSLYGEKPIIHGLETCQRYRDGLQASNGQPDPRVAGLFDTGTNAFVDALDMNFRHVDNAKIEYQAPGGKHTLLEDRKWVQDLLKRNSSSSSGDGGAPTPPPAFLPIVLIRDPFRWMASMVSELVARAIELFNYYF